MQCKNLSLRCALCSVQNYAYLVLSKLLNIGQHLT